ncbi:hypothetical protein CbuK_0297 [Coxiella burnetii CbuK_Q154]|nr:hypothetical protein CbuK_0297 [Coxiella burnetii CbuK_Q154]
MLTTRVGPYTYERSEIRGNNDVVYRPVFRFAHTGYFTDNWELKKPIIKLTDIKYDIKNISLFEKALVLFKIFP